MARLAFVLGLFAAPLGLAQTGALAHVKVAMRDGVRLCTTVFRPAAEGKSPAALLRTPYGKPAEINDGLRAFLGRGLAVVVQDVRGRHDSEGVFRQYLQEPADGEDTLSWIARQPWSDGNVGMFGGSYVGIQQYRIALTGHPALKALAVSVAGWDEYFDRFYSRGGAFKPGHRLQWIAENYRKPDHPMPDFESLVRRLPLRSADRFATGVTLDFFQAALDHPAYDDYWSKLSTRLQAERIRIPVHIATGWYDNFAESDLETFAALRARGVPARIVVGPWGHNLSAAMPEADFGPQASLPVRSLEAEWLTAQLRRAGGTPRPGLHYFLMGANEWLDADTWPLEALKPTPYYLASRTSARTSSGDGALTPAPPRRAGSDRFMYDPASPVPTRGGAVCCNPRRFPWGPLDQSALETRPDVLVYTSPPLKEELRVAGPVSAVLYAATDAPDTDFTAKLVDVHPDGTARILCDGILRLRYREGLDRAVAYKPGSIVQITIPAGVTANVFRAGHRIRLDVSSSNFPRFDRNPNTGGAIAAETSFRRAIQEVHHGRRRPSHILLPVIAAR
jgi:putative CocE/NonD family hydrolase